jgi:hypothetical protein
MGVAVRASDKRRGKWASFRGENSQEDLITRLQREIDERPVARYEVDEIVKVPKLGIRGITNKYYRNGSGWYYTFFTEGCLYTFKESQLLAQGDGMLLEDIMQKIGAGG